MNFGTAEIESRAATANHQTTRLPNSGWVINLDSSDLEVVEADFAKFIGEAGPSKGGPTNHASQWVGGISRCLRPKGLRTAMVPAIDGGSAYGRRVAGTDLGEDRFAFELPLPATGAPKTPTSPNSPRAAYLGDSIRK